MFMSMWMQTIGATLLAVRRCSLMSMRMLGLGSRSAYRLMYLAAVPEQEQAFRASGISCCPASSDEASDVP